MPTPTTHDDQTSRGYPLPHPDNELGDDVQRLRTALQKVNDDMVKASADIEEAEILALALGS